MNCAQAYDASAIIPVSWLIKPDGTVFAKAAGHSLEGLVRG